MEGAWTLTEDGEFVLNEPYRSHLKKARELATLAWTDALVGYLAEQTSYHPRRLADELVRLANERDAPPEEVVTELVVRALEGDV